MRPTHEDRRAAARLDHTPAHPEDDDSIAVRSFLEAVERLTDPASDFATVEILWRDATGDEGQSYIASASGHAELDEAKVRIALEDADGTAVHAFTPDEAERRGWELIALAHRARTGG